MCPALFGRSPCLKTRVNDAPEHFQRIVIGVDPAGSTAEWADQTGIVVAGLGHDSHLYILEDASGSYTPSQWAQVVVDLYHRYRADRICVERNFGGDMCEAVIRSADPSVAIKSVTSSRGKTLRAEPIAALWEQKRAHIVGSMPPLEDQCCNFTHNFDRARDGSPDKLDAMVFAATELMSSAAPGAYFSGAALLIDGQPDVQPAVTQEVFAVLATTSRTGSAAGFVILATNPTDAQERMHVVDWRICEIDEALTIQWLSSAYERVQELAKDWKSLSGPPRILLEMDEFGQAAFELAMWHFNSGGPVVNLCKIERYDEPIPTLDQLVEACRAKINCGAVKIGKPAFERQAIFRSANVNHFLTQVLTFRPEVRDTPVELVTALCTGVSMWNGGIASGAPPTPPEPPPPPPAPLPPHIMLEPGTHVIDGLTVDVPGERGSLVMVYVSVGRHIVDDKITYAITGLGGVRFG